MSDYSYRAKVSALIAKEIATNKTPAQKLDLETYASLVLKAVSEHKLLAKEGQEFAQVLLKSIWTAAHHGPFAKMSDARRAQFLEEMAAWVAQPEGAPAPQHFVTPQCLSDRRKAEDAVANLITAQQMLELCRQGQEIFEFNAEDTSIFQTSGRSGDFQVGCTAEESALDKAMDDAENAIDQMHFTCGTDAGPDGHPHPF